MWPCRVRSPTVPRPYSEQEPLDLSERDVDVVLAVVCSDAVDGAPAAEVRKVTSLLWTFLMTVAGELILSICGPLSRPRQTVR